VRQDDRVAFALEIFDAREVGREQLELGTRQRTRDALVKVLGAGGHLGGVGKA
jgi:hypothetical protein